MIHKEYCPGCHQIKVTFSVPADHPALPLTLVGDFNGWQIDTHPLQVQESGCPSATVTLETGRRYAFRYVSQTGEWFNDGFADDLLPNGFGGNNSIIDTSHSD